MAFLVLGGFLAGPVSLRAELKWAQLTMELYASGTASVIEARFKFTNEGSRPVDIWDITTSCGCTTVALAQRHYESGQGGEIVAHFAVGERTGLQKKMILVSASGQPGPTTLSLLVHLPDLVHVQPAFVTWAQGEPAAAKTIQIVAAQTALPLHVDSVIASDPALALSLRMVQDGSKYEISVTPGSTQQRLSATVTINCRVGEEAKVFHAYATVRTSSATQ